MAETKKSSSSLKVDYDLNSFLTARGEVDRVKISGNTASWENGLITVTENSPSFSPTIYSSFPEANDRSQPNKQIDGSEYFPLATVTVTNNQDLDKPLLDIFGIALISKIKVSLEGENQTTKFAPLYLQRVGIDIKDFSTRSNNTDKVEFPGVLIRYQNLKIIDSQTGRTGASPYYFGYVGAVEGDPREINKNQLLIGNNNKADLKDGETKTYTLYGRIFSIEKAPVDIASITEDRGTKGDFKTSDDTLIFNGTAEAKSKVKILLDGSPIGTTQTDDKGNWSYDYQKTKLADGNYKLSAKYTNSQIDYKIAEKDLVIEPDATYNIDLDFSDKSFNQNDPKIQAIQTRIKEAAQYWESIILDDIPDVKDSNGKWIDDLEITFKVEALKNDQGKLDGKGNTLAFANTFKGRDPLTGQSQPTVHLPYKAIITIDRADIDELLKTEYGLYTLKHEIAHAIGFNSQTFAEKNLVDTIKTPDDKTVLRYGFNGKNALHAYKDLGGKAAHNTVPLEDNDNTPGHWNEWLFPDFTEGTFNLFSSTDELMTYSTPPGEDDVFLSKLTLGAFQDLGFNVDINKGTNNQVDQGSVFYTNPLLNIDY